VREYCEFTPKRILVATDFSNLSHGALKYAKQLAGYFSAKILLVHIVDDKEGMGSVPEHLDSAETALQQMASTLSYDDVRCAVIARAGGIRETILGLIRERDADLLVVGTRGKGSKSGDSLGSVAEMLLRVAPCPVLTVGKNAQSDSYEHTHAHSVLFPTDFSVTSRAALSYAECLTTHLRGTLLVLHVNEKDPQHSECEDELKSLVKEVKTPAIKLESITRVGQPADVIVEVSTERRVDFIVIGVHGPGQASSVRNYGTAYDVIRLARCPVFTLFTSQDEMHHSRDNEGPALVAESS
jgi:nucleotide-binding universal stress UspA family protein